MGETVTLKEVERLAAQLSPDDQATLVSHVIGWLKGFSPKETEEEYRKEYGQRVLAWLDECARVAEQIKGQGKFDSAKDLREIREERIADIERNLRGREHPRQSRSDG